jgi:two-component system response regulator NreC
MSKELRIVVVEDHETVRAGVRMIVDAEADMKVVGEAANGRIAIDVALELEPDVVLMDISMPVLNGLKAAATLKRLAPDIKILTLTRHTDDSYLQELFEAGVSGYVLKQSSPKELARAIRVVAAGETYLDPAVAAQVVAGFNHNSRLRGEAKNKSLSPRESEVLHDVALGYSNKEIAEKMDVSVKTVEAHKASSMQKLNLASRKDIVRYAILRNWMQEP